MCYAAPGPRCSGHARKDLRLAQEKVDRLRGSMVGGLTPTVGMGETRDALVAAELELRRAEEEFESTPAGIAALKGKAAVLADWVGSGGVDETGEYARLAARIEVGQRRRAEQLTAYKKATAGKVASVDDGTMGDSAADEAAAVIPAPRCACITYEYKGECEHVRDLSAEEARLSLVPTTAEASRWLHEAHAEARSTLVRLRAAKASSEQQTDISDLFYDSGVQYSQWADMDAQRKVREAEEAFYGTPGGQAYLAQKVESLRGNYGGQIAGSARTFAARQQDGLRARQESEQQYTELTGKQPVGEAGVPVPPGVAGACACPDGQWTGNCAHTDEDPARQRQLRAGYAAEVAEAARVAERAQRPWWRRLVG